MARPDGVLIASERFWAFAAADGRIEEGATVRPPALVRHVPLVRGLVRLVVALAPLLRRGEIAAARERWWLLIALLAPFTLVLLPQQIAFVAGLVVTLALLC